MHRSLVALSLLILAGGCSGKKDGGGPADDETPPTPPGGASLSVTTAGSSLVSLAWAAATDDVSVPDALQYRAFKSSADNLDAVADIEANGTPLGEFAAQVFAATAPGLAPESDYWFNVIVRDEAGNQAAYPAAASATLGVCADDPPGGCPAPDADHMTACGRLYDVGTNGPIEAALPTGNACAAVTADGPCSLEIRFFDALDFAGNPATATPIVPGTLYVDDCGRYAASNIATPGLGYLAVVVDDAPSTTDRYRSTGVTTTSSPTTQADLSLWGTTITTDAAWTSSAGLAGPTFADRGVLAFVYRYQGVPRAGVLVRRNGAPITGDDNYFSDADGARTTVDSSLLVTGSNGTALVLNSSFVSHDGLGNEPGACVWPSMLGATIPGTVSFQVMDAQTGGGAVCP